jgi:hypothetical protein
MSEQVTRSISVLLHSPETDRPLLELLGVLAAQPHSTIVGLFLEDINLLRLGELPSARELCRVTITERRLETGEIQRQLRVRARTLQRALEATAVKAGAQWAFRTARGTLASLLAEAARETDLLILGPAPRALPRPLDLTLVSVARQAAGPILALFDGSAASGRAVMLAAELARERARRLIVYCLTTGEQDEHALHARLEGLLGGRHTELRCAESPGLEPLLKAARSEAASLLVIGDSAALWEPAAVRALEQRLNCPAVVVR